MPHPLSDLHPTAPQDLKGKRTPGWHSSPWAPKIMPCHTSWCLFSLVGDRGQAQPKR